MYLKTKHVMTANLTKTKDSQEFSNTKRISVIDLCIQNVIESVLKNSPRAHLNIV